MVRAAVLFVLVAAMGCEGAESFKFSGAPDAPGEPGPCPDNDEDGYANFTCGGEDCDDGDATTHPGATEALWRTEALRTAGGSSESWLEDATLVLDLAGRPHVAAEETGDVGWHRIVELAAVDGAWQESHVVEWRGGRGSYVAGALDPDGQLAVAFVDDDRGGCCSWLATGPPENRVVEQIGRPTPWGLALGIDRRDATVHVLGADQDALKSWSGRSGHLVGPASVDGDGQQPAMSERNGIVHAVWRSGELVVYGTTFDGVWSVETIGRALDPAGEPRWTEMSRPSIAVDERERVHVAWWQSEMGVVYARREGEWTVDVVDAEGESPRVAAAGAHVAIAFAKDGLWLASRGDDGDWSEELLGTGTPAGLALEPDGAAHLIARGAEPGPGATLDYWTNRSNGDGVDRDCDGADDPPCTPDADADGDGELPAACDGADCDDGDRQVHPGAIDRVGDDVDENCDGVDGIDHDGDHIASVESGGTDCNDLDPRIRPFLRDDPDDCVDEDCDGLGVGDDDGDGVHRPDCGGRDCDDTDPDIFPGAPDEATDGIDESCDGVDGRDADGDGIASVASGGVDCNDADEDVHPGAPDGTVEWHHEVVEPGREAALDDRPSIALRDGAPAIVYHARGPDRVELLRRAEDQWYGEDVAEVDDELVCASLVFDAGGAAHVVHRKDASDDLRHATDASGDWVSETIDATGVPGFYTATAVDASGALHVVYVDRDERDALQYATNETGVWELQTVDDVGAAGHDAAIALDAAGAVHASYAEVGADDLRYATNASGSWVVETVDDGPDRGHHSAIAVDPEGTIHIVYREGGHDPGGDGTLWHASKAGGAWELEAVDETFGAGLWSSMVIDAEGSLHVAEVAHDNLRLATRRLGLWQVITLVVDDCQAASLAVDAVGFRHIAYLHAGEDELRYATETPLPDGTDQNCDGVDGVDADGDGHASQLSGGDDCADATALIRPGVPDPPGDGIDADCDGRDG